MKEPIKDSRLTPTMERIRSGSTQLFREADKGGKSFIDKDNCDVSLTHPEKDEMYAELIEGKWYWVSGCAECNGKPRDWMSYVECEKHNVCASCKTKSADIKGVAWAREGGWVCEECLDKEKAEAKREAFEALNGEEPDCLYTDEVICPHCGSVYGSYDIHDGDSDLTCYTCDGNFSLEVEYTVTYSTSKK